MTETIPEWLGDEFERLNREHFEGALPPVTFAAGRFGGCFAVYIPGVCMIQFDPRVLDQSREWVSDTLLHELIHHHLSETSKGDRFFGDPDKDHGRRFCSVANRIGGKLGLPPVEAGSDSAIDWPQSVRPPGYATWR